MDQQDHTFCTWDHTTVLHFLSIAQLRFDKFHITHTKYIVDTKYTQPASHKPHQRFNLTSQTASTI